jgi:hypothetical protein
MEFLAYFCVSGIVWFVVLASVARARQRFGPYTRLSLLFVLSGLAFYILASMWMGALAFGVGQARSVPQDYLERGWLGVAVLLILLVGLLSPAIAAWIVSLRYRAPAAQ